MNIRYHVELSEAERRELTALVGSGRQALRPQVQERARIRSTPPTAGSATTILPRPWLSAARPFTGPNVASLKAISKPP